MHLRRLAFTITSAIDIQESAIINRRAANLNRSDVRLSRRRSWIGRAFTGSIAIATAWRLSFPRRLVWPQR
ncbi:MAG: hypothetical protein ACK557_19875, partial [Planctomycetota bacterium]